MHSKVYKGFFFFLPLSLLFCFEAEGSYCQPHCQLSKPTVSTWQLQTEQSEALSYHRTTSVPQVCARRENKKERSYSFIPNGSSRTWRMWRMGSLRFAVAYCCMCEPSRRFALLSQCMFSPCCVSETHANIFTVL